MSSETLNLLYTLLDGFNLLVLGYFLALNGAYLGTSIFAFKALRQYSRRLKSVELDDLLRDEALPPVTLLAPAYNEAATCVQSVRSLLALRYPEYEVIVVNDGSKDDTLQTLVEAFDLEPVPRAPVVEIESKPIRAVYRSRIQPKLWVVDKENGGKADALNAGLCLCRTPLFCAIDVDTLIEREALTRIARIFMEDRRTVAVGGIIRIVNDSVVESGSVREVRLPRKWIARFQVLEYLRAFLAGRMGWDALDATLIISGAFGVFRRSIVADVGGYATDTVGEDMELVVRLHRHCFENGIPHTVRFLPDPVAWTECPESIRVLGRQRDRWQRGLMESLWRHRIMLFNPKYGRVGTLAFPYFFFLEMLGPIIEAIGYVGFVLAIVLGRASPTYVTAFLALAIAFGIALSIAAIALEELSFRRYPRTRDLLALLGLSFVETLGYRQLSTWWRLKGFISKARGVQSWGSMERKGFSTGPKSPGSIVVLTLGLAIPTLASSGALAAQADRGWTFGAAIEREVIDSELPQWDDWEVVRGFARHRGEVSTVGVQIASERRFRTREAVVTLDAYRDVGPGRYLHLRLRKGEKGEILPDWDGRFEIFQTAGLWEASASFWYMEFDRPVRILGAGLARYAGAWYIRATGTRAQNAGESAFAAALLARRSNADGGALTLVLGRGEEVVVLGAGPVLDLRTTGVARAELERWLNQTIALTTVVGRHTFEGAPTRWPISLGLMIRPR